MCSLLVLQGKQLSAVAWGMRTQLRPQDDSMLCRGRSMQRALADRGQRDVKARYSVAKTSAD
jgi:hypothetical protein